MEQNKNADCLLSRLDVVILNLLHEGEALNELNGMTRNEILRFDDEHKVTSMGNLRVRLKNLQNAKLVNNGVKDGNATTYYITDKGIQIVKKLHDESCKESDIV